MKVSLQGDLVIGRGGDLMDGPELPKELESTPLMQLRYVNGAVVDASTITTFFIDPSGRKHATRNGPGSATWPAVKCTLREMIVMRDDGTWAVETPSEAISPQIKAECERRITAVMSLAAQSNMLARAVSLSRTQSKGQGGGLGAEKKKMLDDLDEAWEWVTAMREACQAMIEAVDAEYAQDFKWPAPSDNIKAVAKKF